EDRGPGGRPREPTRATAAAPSPGWSRGESGKAVALSTPTARDELGCVYVAAGFGSPLDPQDLGKDAIRQTRNDDARESGHFRPLLQGNSVNVWDVPFFSLLPVGAVERAVLDAFRNVPRLDLLA